MPIIASYTKSQFSNAPEGLHPAVCVDVVDLGLKTTRYGDKHKVRIVWQIEERDPEHDRRHSASQMFTLSLHPDSVLSKTLEAWRGRKFTDDERNGFDLEKLIGAPCQVQIVHAPGTEGRVYANVQACVPLGKGMTALRPENYTRVKDRAQTPSEGAVSPVADDDRVPF